MKETLIDGNFLFGFVWLDAKKGGYFEWEDKLFGIWNNLENAVGICSGIDGSGTTNKVLEQTKILSTHTTLLPKKQQIN